MNAFAAALPDELIVDLFAGGGGASEAILAATGRHPDIAINHDREAVALHRANHPTTRHYCCDIAEADPSEVCAGRRVALLWASPDCKHHSKARGGKPAEKKIRALAWHVVRWAAKVRPRVIALENVEEFQDWGPLGDDSRPIKARKGESFRAWCAQLRGLGYIVEHRELVAADYGAPTTRKRLFLIARCDGQPIRWPARTHTARRKSPNGYLFDSATPVWRAAAEIIDWSLPCPSIFGRKKSLAPKTQTRIARGIKRFVIDAPRPFIVPVTHTGPRATPSVDDPLATVTGANRGEFALTAPTVLRTDFKGSRMPGAYDPAEPVNTITSQQGHGVAAAHLLRTDMQSAADRNGIHEASDPVRTVTSGGGFAVSAAHLTKFREGSHGADVAEPMPTVTANSFVKRPGGAAPLGVVSAYLGRQFGSTVSGRTVEAPHPTVVSDGGGAKSQVVAASLDAYYATGRPASPDDPLRTATALPRHGLTAAFLEQANTGMVGHDARDPLSTIVAGGGQDCGWGSTQRPIQVELLAQPGSKREQVLRFLWDHFGEPTALEHADPLASARGRLRFGLVVLGGDVFQIADIGMRMLTPRELYGAQGFRPDYVIEIEFEGRPLTKTAQTRMAGNSVSPPPATALLLVNLPASLAQRKAA